MNRQVTPAHWGAYFLNPKNAKVAMDQPRMDEITQFYEAYGARREFLHYRHQLGPFYEAPFWDEENVEDFWLDAVGYVQTKASLEKSGFGVTDDDQGTTLQGKTQETSFLSYLTNKNVICLIHIIAIYDVVY